MKTIKVFAGNKRLKDIYPHASRFEVFKYKVARFLRKVFIISFLAGLIWGSFKLGSVLSPVTVVEAQVQPDKEIPVLKRIKTCESGGTHTKDGQVIFNANNNGSVDIGLYQINSVWNKEATKLGLNLTVEKDNEAFAKYLYETRGTEPWFSSKKCWQK